MTVAVRAEKIETQLILSTNGICKKITTKTPVNVSRIVALLKQRFEQDFHVIAIKDYLLLRFIGNLCVINQYFKGKFDFISI